MNTLSVKSCIAFGFQRFKARPWFFVGISVVLLILNLALGVIETLVALAVGSTPFLGFDTGDAVSSVVSLLLSTLIAMGIMWVFLKAHDDVSSVSFGDLWHPTHYVAYLGTTLGVAVVVLVGLVLLVVPGVIAGLALWLATLIALEKKMLPIAAMKESVRLTKGHRWKILLLWLALVAINIVGLLLLFVGLLVSIPITLLAVVHAYRTLSGQEALTPAV